MKYPLGKERIKFLVKIIKWASWNTLFKRPYCTNRNSIEIEVTTACNLLCIDCNRSCRQAPSLEGMSVEQVRTFISETVALKKKWKWVNLLGGEPTLHPDLIEICQILLDYKHSYSPTTKICLFTNGFKKMVKDTLDKIPDEIIIRNTQKRNIVHDYHFCYNIAPNDLKHFQKNKPDYARGCWITENCGLGMSRYGYYPCGPGASADRIFGWDIGIKKISGVTAKATMKQREILCQYCGLYLYSFPFMKDKLLAEFKEGKRSGKEVMSDSWKSAYRSYNQTKPDLGTY
ncbi:Fe-S oxidoreductase [Candidatus Scalindua japonica]|uniref:Fe-S oxidoreductase n=1 Tax=Candidatus Scalindua japonica TaxID=1284222 RepID=A0A286U268_9BACT|nr:radical SAM protein [Candidatus Scalindua japonica]GAX62215.1 Fe-S oxidoreductase [Candidatus Scalindua japonica]